MYMIREVFYCRPGKVRDLLARFQALNEVIKERGLGAFRLYTDVAGERFWTLVIESEHESLDAMHDMEAGLMTDPRVQEAMTGYHDLVESGRREIYTLES